MYIPKLHKIWLCQNDKGGIYMYPKMANRQRAKPQPQR